MLDRPLTSYHLVLGAAGLLSALGMLMVLSASSVSAYVNYDDSYFYVKRQAFFLFVGLAAIVVIVKLPVRGLKIAGWVGLIGSALLLILTYTPLGYEFQGNRNWVQLGPSFLRLQPSEFAKLALVVWGADVLARKQKLLDQPKHLFVPYLPAAGLIVLLIVFQGDAGTAAVVIGMVAAVLWMVGAPLRLFVGLAGLGVAGMAALVLSSPDPDESVRGVPESDRRRRRDQPPVHGRDVRDRVRRLVGRRARCQPAEVGVLAGGALGLHLRGDRRGAGAVRQSRRAADVPGPGLRRHPDRAALRRRLQPLRRRRASPPGSWSRH